MDAPLYPMYILNLRHPYIVIVVLLRLLIAVSHTESSQRDLVLFQKLTSVLILKRVVVLRGWKLLVVQEQQEQKQLLKFDSIGISL